MGKWQLVRTHNIKYAIRLILISLNDLLTSFSDLKWSLITILGLGPEILGSNCLEEETMDTVIRRRVNSSWWVREVTLDL